MRVFVSFYSQDHRQAERVVARLQEAVPRLETYFAPESNTGGAYWLPRLADELAIADAVLLLIGRRLGPWQEMEYFEAMRLSRAGGRPLVVPLLLEDEAPGLPFLDQLHQISLQPTLAETVALLRAAFGGAAPPESPPAWRRTNPYCGLEPFTSDNAAYFFGRDALTNQVIEALAASLGEVLTLVGNSGVGKSSLVMAGLFSALRSRLWPGDLERDWPLPLRESHRWQMVTVRAGERPLKALALGFTRLWLEDPATADAQARAWAQNFAAGSELVDLADAAAEKLGTLAGGGSPPARFLLYVDQGEELYVRAEPGEAERFGRLITRAAASGKLSVLTSLRADYYGRLQADPALFPASRCIDVPPLSPAELEAVIATPAERLGVRLGNPDQVRVIAGAAAREAGALPLLSVLLEEAWEAMRQAADGGVLHLPDDLVDLSRPLTKRAEAFLTSRPDRRAALRRLFTVRLALVTKDGEAMRRRVSRAECTDDEWATATALAEPEWRLVTLGEEGGTPTAEVAHETLLRAWPRLAGWLDEAREFLIWRGQLEAARREWEAAPVPMRDEAVLMGLALATARAWGEERGDALSQDDRAFIARSIEIHDARRVEEARRARELTEERERSRRRANWISRIASAAALIFLGLGGWAVTERQRADVQRDKAARAAVKATQAAERAARQRDIAEASVAKFFATEAARLDARANGPLGVLLGVEAVRLDPTTRTDQALRDAIDRYRWQPIAAHEGAVFDIAISRDGRFLVSSGADGAIRLWNLDDPAFPQRLLASGDAQVGDVAIDGDRVAAVSGAEILLWRLDDPDAPPKRLPAPGGKANALTLAPGGEALVATGPSGAVRYWPLADGGPPHDLELGGTARAAAFSGDGRYFAVGGDKGRVALWRAAAPDAPPTVLKAGQEEVYALAFSGDSRRLVAGGFEPLRYALVSIWNLDDLTAGPTAIVLQPTGAMAFGFTVGSVAMGTTGDKLLVGTSDGPVRGAVRMWFPDDPSKNRTLMQFAHRVSSVAVAPSRWLAVADVGGLIHLYDMRGSAAEPRRYAGNLGFVFSVALINGDRTIVTGGSDGRVMLHDALEPSRDARLAFEAQAEIRALAYSPRGRLLAVGDEKGGVAVLSPEAPDVPPRRFAGGDGTVYLLAFDPAGKSLAIADNTGLRIVDAVRSDLAPRRLEAGPDTVIGVRFDAEGIHAATRDGALLTWPATGGAAPTAQRVLSDEQATNAAFSPDGRWLALTHANNRLSVHDLKAPDASAIPFETPFQDSAFSVFGYPLAFSPDGALLAFGGGGGRIWLWRVGAWDVPPIALRGHEEGLTSMAFGADGRVLASGGVDSVARLWTLADALTERACKRSGRNLTLADWRRYWGERDYRRTCKQWPLPDDLIRAAAFDFAKRGDADATLRLVRRAWGSEAQRPGFDAAVFEARHRRLLAVKLIHSAIDFADPGIEAPDLDRAVDRLTAARRIAPELDHGTLGIGAGSWNRLCWNGAIWGKAAAVLAACDLAVDKATAERVGYYRDSRGVARAAAGDLEGARADFAAFIDWADRNARSGPEFDLRRQWLKALEAGRNPIDRATLQTLRKETM